jgi:hypothetical protein
MDVERGYREGESGIPLNREGAAGDERWDHLLNARELGEGLDSV